MGIDIRNERLIYLRDVTKLDWLPTRHGRRPSLSAVHNWALAGVRGIRLETVKLPFGKATTEAALLRFFERLGTPQATSDTPTEKQVETRRARARQLCEAMGV